MKKGFVFMLIGMVFIVIISILKLVGLERNIVNICYLISFIVEIVGLLYIIDSFKK